MIEKTGVNYLIIKNKTMKKEKKITRYRLKQILKKDDNFINMYENIVFEKKRFNINFDNLIYTTTINEIRKYDNEFFTMRYDDNLKLVIYK